MKSGELLCHLEGEVMEVMWERGHGTVWEVLEALKPRHPLAYTTVMTVMNHLVAKGLLGRVRRGQANEYTVALGREAFLEEKSRQAVEEVLARFGDLAIARFMEAVGYK